MKLAPFLVTVLASTASAQTLHGPTGVDYQRRVVFARRMDAFLDQWVSAVAERREAALGFLEQAAGGGAPAGAWPDVVALGGALRILSGDTSEGDLAKFAASLDLAVVPGAISSLGEGERGEPLRVRVYSADPFVTDQLRRDMDVTLHWMDAEGAERRARGSSVLQAAFGDPGFDLFIRAPQAETLAKGGVKLVLELGLGEARARGVPVEVPYIEDFGARLEQVTARHAEDGRPGVVVNQGALDVFETYGVPPCTAADARDTLALLEGDLPKDEPLPAGLDWYPVSLRGLESATTWRYEPLGEVRRTLLVPNTKRTTPGALLYGRLGASWRAFANQTGTRLYSIDLGSSAFAGAIDAIRVTHGDTEVGLLLRGDAVHQMLTECLVAPKPEPDFLAALTELATLGAKLPDVPTLLVTTAPSAPADELANVERIQVEVGSAFTAELDFPELVGGWIERMP